jgi:hypothetical protein
MALTVLMLAAPSAGQTFAIPWWTIDAGGGAASGGSFAVTATIGQPDPGEMAGGVFTLVGGFWPGMHDSCYPDCNGVGGLTIADFGCFQTKFVAGDPYADCNGVGGLTIADFGCFQTGFVAGCP